MSDGQVPPKYLPQEHTPRPRSDGATPVGHSAPEEPRTAPGPSSTGTVGEGQQIPERRSITASPPIPRPKSPQGGAIRLEDPANVRPPSFEPGGRLSRNEPPPLRPTHYRPPTAPPIAPAPPIHAAPAAPQGRQKRKRRLWPKIVITLIVLLLAWPVGLAIWANGRIAHTEALSGAPNTPGATYLLVGSDSRADGTIPDGTDGQRADSILMLHKAANGQTSLISLPRDTYVEIPDHGGNKLNASYAFGGPSLLVRSVEKITGLTIDHYVEIGMGGVVNLVDGVGGVNLCLDYDVNDEKSELVWQAGCHLSDGRTALAFARMRYSDPLGDIGRAARQRQVIGAIVKASITPATFINPFRQIALIEAATNAITTDPGTGVWPLGQLALAFRSTTGEGGFTGAPPIASLDYRPGGNVGSAVLLDPERAPDFFLRLMNGELTSDDFNPVQ